MTGAFTIEVDGAVLAGEERGPADSPRAPIVLVHGFGGSRATWDRVGAALPPDRRVLRYDLRGFGASRAEDLPFSHADDLLVLLDGLGISRAMLVGLSLGGATVIDFALDHPERVERLVAVSPALVAWEWSEPWRAGWARQVVAARAGDMTLARRLWWEHELFATTRAGAAADELRRSIDAFAGSQWIKDWQRPEMPDVDRLSSLAVPTLLLTGELDWIDFRIIAGLIEAAVPDVRRIDFPGAGHMLPLERADEVAAAIAAF